MMERDLSQQHCKPCEGGHLALTPSEISPLLASLVEWQCAENSLSLHRRIEFKGFYKTMSFINAVAWIAQQEQHHPDINVWFFSLIARLCRRRDSYAFAHALLQ